MRISILFLICVLAVAADSVLPVSESAQLNHAAKEEFDSLVFKTLRGADLLTIKCLVPLAKGDLATASINDAKLIHDLIVHIRAEESKEPWYLGSFENEPARYQLSVPCQCFGEFEVSFYKNGVLITSFTVHHRRHIRSQILTNGGDVVLEKDSIDRLYMIILNAVPAFEKAHKPASPAPVSTPTTAAPAADTSDAAQL